MADRKKVFTAQKIIAKFLDEELGVEGIVEFTETPTVKQLLKRYCEHQMRNVWYSRINNSGSFDEKDAANIRCFIMGELFLLFKSRNWMTAMTFGDFKRFFKDKGFRFEGYGLNAIIPCRMAALLKSYSLKIRPLIVKAMTADSVKFFAEHRLGGNIVSLKGILFYVDSFSGATYNIQLDNVEKADFVMPPPQSDPSLPAPPLKTQAPTASAFVVAKTRSSAAAMTRSAANMPPFTNGSTAAFRCANPESSKTCSAAVSRSAATNDVLPPPPKEMITGESAALKTQAPTASPFAIAKTAALQRGQYGQRCCFQMPNS